MVDRYDVVIAGAGPAALSALAIWRRETTTSSSFSKRSRKTSSPPEQQVDRRDVPVDDVLLRDPRRCGDVVHRRRGVESPNNHYKSYQPGAVLEFADFKRFLVADGRESGAEYRFDSRVSRPILDDDASSRAFGTTATRRCTQRWSSTPPVPRHRSRARSTWSISNAKIRRSVSSTRWRASR